MRGPILVSSDDPYGRVIADFVAKEFPTQFADCRQVMEYLTTTIVGSSQTRLGPLPDPEVLVSIRQTIRHAMERHVPIPMLTLWGSKKPWNNGSIDVAELSALKTLELLQRRVQHVYEPGIDLRMRIEDLSGYYLFRDEGIEAINASDNYVSDFRKLLKILNLRFIDPLLESEIAVPEAFNKKAGEIEQLLYFCLVAMGDGNDGESDRLLGLLHGMGWVGDIPEEQRAYYYRQYEKMHPGCTPDQKERKLARYFASSWARAQLHMRGDKAEWHNNFLTISFIQPIPGVGENFHARRLFYRTLPEKMARTHLPAWRARGYLRVNGHATPKLATQHEKLDLHPCEIVLKDDECEVKVRADYEVE